MNQRLTSARPELNRSETAAGFAVHGVAPRVDYDDGNPATVVVPARRTTAMPATPLATVPREAATDYDDGDPATIAC